MAVEVLLIELERQAPDYCCGILTYATRKMMGTLPWALSVDAAGDIDFMAWAGGFESDGWLARHRNTLADGVWRMLPSHVAVFD